MKWDTEGPPAVPVGAGPHPITGQTTTAVKQGKREGPEQTTDATLGYAQVVGRPAVVGFAAGLTLNLGNYESARVDVRIEYPCTATLPDIAAAYEFCKEWVTQRLQAEAREAREVRAPDRGY